MYGVVCTAGIIFTTDKTLAKQSLPTATVGEYYEFILQYPTDSRYMRWSLDSDELPEGIEIIPADSDIKYSNNGNYIIKGTPKKAGSYKFYMKGMTYVTMCGNSDYYYPYSITVLPANK